jgi:6-phosphogluconolactonase
MTNVHEFAKRDALMRATAERIADVLIDAIAERGEACAALSGGSTPEPAYRALAMTESDWGMITFALVDERFAPPFDPASNQGMIEAALDWPLRRGARFKPMYYDAERVEQAADRADAIYKNLHIDIAVMGMGEDGHTASWFPDMAGLADVLDPANPRTVVAVHAQQAAGARDRLTLTLSALGRVGEILLLITGDAKRRRLETAIANRDAPVSRLFESPITRAEIWWAP